MVTLYHYAHCPYCVRVRMALKHLNIQYTSVIMPYDEEDALIKMTGKKMLPIIKLSDGSYLNESLDIIKLFDTKNTLKTKESLVDSNLTKMNSLLSSLGKNIHPLCMPYWIYTKEFNEKSRNYFQVKKEKSKGPFSELVRNKEYYLTELNKTLEELEEKLEPFYESESFTLNDILLASHLWGMFIYPEFQFKPKIYQYLMSVKNLCQFDYHEGFWD